MYTIEELKIEEISSLLIKEVADHFLTMELGKIDFKILARELIEGVNEPNSVILALKKNGVIIGGLSASIDRYLNGKLHAEQRFLFILKEHRGAYLKLMIAFELWAENMGADYVISSVLLRENADVQLKLLKKRGYTALDIYFTKRIKRS